MQTLLQLNTSLFAAGGNSTQMADAFVAGWRAAHPDGRVIVRDFAREPIPHLSAAHVQAFATPPERRSAEQAELAALSDALIAEIKNADVIALGLPMYNFGVPSTLKAYFDHIARAGIAFRYTADGPQGLLGERKVYIFAARGGLYRGTPRDTQTAYVTAFLNFVGITDIEFVYAEGLNISAESKAKAIAGAQDEIARLAERAARTPDLAFAT
jgi:FMN-dependent NADH-azoreductase